MNRLMPPSQPLTGTAPHKQSKAGSPVLTVATGTAGTHPTLVSLPCLTDVPASRVPTSTPSPRSGSHESPTPSCVPMAAVAGYESRFRTFNDRTGAALGTHESRKERIYGHLTLIEPARGGWTTCPSRTAPRPIRPLAGCGRDTTVRALLSSAFIRKAGNPAMSQTPHPLDLEIEEMYETYTFAVRVVSRDGEVDPEEHRLLQLITSHYRDVASYRQREELADSLKRNGLSRVTKDRARDAGLQIVNLDDERRKRTSNVVQLFPDQERA